jgi:uncharacterized membrane protein YjfL (UPF0719 family)
MDRKHPTSIRRRGKALVAAVLVAAALSVGGTITTVTAATNHDPAQAQAIIMTPSWGSSGGVLYML